MLFINLKIFFNHFSANISRSVTRSYCGSEISESDYYSPYSFYGSEAGTDVAGNDFADTWGGGSVSVFDLIFFFYKYDNNDNGK